MEIDKNRKRPNINPNLMFPDYSYLVVHPARGEEEDLFLKTNHVV